MSDAPATRADEPLAPVRGFLLARAREQADHIRAEAAGQADLLLAQARRQQEAILDAAREQGERDGARMAAAARAQGRRRARALLLTAQRQACQTARERARAAVSALREKDDYPALRERLARIARELVGPDAVVTEAPGGGVLAQAPGRRVDCSLATLADRAADVLGAQLEGLWAR